MAAVLFDISISFSDLAFPGTVQNNFRSSSSFAQLELERIPLDLAILFGRCEETQIGSLKKQDPDTRFCLELIVFKLFSDVCP